MWFWKEVWRKANTRAKRAGCRGVPRFAKGVYQGVLSQARLIRETLRGCSHPSHVYEGQFCFEMERSLRAVEKFKDLGVDFKPAVKELRAALDEPIRYPNPNVSCKRVLDKH